MDLEIVILSEVSQTEEDKFPMISLICGILKKMMQMNLFTKQKVTHRHKFIVNQRVSWEVVGKREIRSL